MQIGVAAGVTTSELRLEGGRGTVPHLSVDERTRGSRALHRPRRFLRPLDESASQDVTSRDHRPACEGCRPY